MAGATTVFTVALVTLCSLAMVAAGAFPLLKGVTRTTQTLQLSHTCCTSTDIKITVFKCNPSSPRQVWRYNSTNNEIQLPNYHYSGPGNYCLDCQVLHTIYTRESTPTDTDAAHRAALSESRPTFGHAAIRHQMPTKSGS